MKTILLVEDDINIRAQLGDFLKKEGFKILALGNVTQARQADLSKVDLAIVDWNLPDGEGLELIKSWRSRGENVPVILLTARTDVIDKVLGLEFGAQDYIVKPFDNREVLARARVQLREPVSKTDIWEVAGVRMQDSSREVSFNGNALELTKTEFDVLAILVRNPGRVFTREELLSKVWGTDSDAETRTVDMHVSKLRQKTAEGLIKTVRGLGYKLKVK